VLEALEPDGLTFVNREIDFLRPQRRMVNLGRPMKDGPGLCSRDNAMPKIRTILVFVGALVGVAACSASSGRPGQIVGTEGSGGSSGSSGFGGMGGPGPNIEGGVSNPFTVRIEKDGLVVTIVTLACACLSDGGLVVQRVGDGQW
jgi:hypothetical protein